MVPQVFEILGKLPVPMGDVRGVEEMLVAEVVDGDQRLVRDPDDAARVAFYRQLNERLDAIPGVEAAGIGFPLPMGRGNFFLAYYVQGRPAPACTVSPLGPVNTSSVIAASPASSTRASWRSGPDSGRRPRTAQCSPAAR